MPTRGGDPNGRRVPCSRPPFGRYDGQSFLLRTGAFDDVIRAWWARSNCSKPGPVDSTKPTITIPLFLGHLRNGANVWYVLTDVDDPDAAAELGLNFSTKMTFMSQAARTANLDQNGDLLIDKRKG